MTPIAACRRRRSIACTQVIAEKAKESNLPLEPFTVHDLRRTGSTILNELGFNGDWIEKCLAPRGRPLIARGLQQGRVRRAAAPHAAGVGRHDGCVGGG